MNPLSDLFWDAPLELPRGRQSPRLASSREESSKSQANWSPSVQSSLRVLRIRAGEKIYGRGDEVEGVFYIKSGAVKLSSQFESPKGRLSIESFVADILGAGEFFGFQDFVLQSSYQQEAVAIKNSEIFLYPSSLVKKAMEQGGSLNEELLKDLAQQISRREERAKYQYLASVNERICQTLLHLAQKFGEPTPQGTWIRLKLSRSELAQLAGTINESLSRHLSELKESGLIEVQGKDILIRNLDNLRKNLLREGERNEISSGNPNPSAANASNEAHQ